jgi:hypothetical protein
MIADVRVRSWTELNDELFRDTWYAPHGRFRGPFVYRGVSNATWDLQTSLMRLGGRYDQVEGSLLRNFRKYGHRSHDTGESFWHWLAVAQHHGLPTRLLDWSMSPHVAAHFATEDLDQFVNDGVIWCADMIRLHELLPARLRHILSEEHAFVFTTTMLDRFASSLGDFDEKLQSGVLFLEPPSLDDRIVNQAAFLSIMAPATARLDQWLRDTAPQLCRRVIIPASVKLEVRDKLDMMNITERMIYPGLDGLSKWLKRYYSPLNIMEVVYPAGVLAGEPSRLAVVETCGDGEFCVKLLADGEEPARTRIASREDGLWYDLERDCRITVKPRPSARLAEVASKYMRQMRRGAVVEES